jgi:hypothetical protein
MNPAGTIRCNIAHKIAWHYIAPGKPSPSAPGRHCGKHWVRSDLSFCSPFSRSSELLIIGPWSIPNSKSRTMSGTLWLQTRSSLPYFYKSPVAADAAVRRQAGLKACTLKDRPSGLVSAAQRRRRHRAAHVQSRHQSRWPPCGALPMRLLVTLNHVQMRSGSTDGRANRHRQRQDAEGLSLLLGLDFPNSRAPRARRKI